MRSSVVPASNAAAAASGRDWPEAVPASGGELPQLVDAAAQWQEQERRELELERDALADQLGQTFEELHWLRTIAAELSTADAGTDVGTLAGKILPSLRAMIRAESVVLLPSPSIAQTDDKPLLSAGPVPLTSAEMDGLGPQLESQFHGQPIVFNRVSPCQQAVIESAARNLLAVPLNHGQKRYGWLVALNRSVSPRAAHQRSDLESPEFGTYEAGLMTTAAGMLAGHAHNVELFRAEECLKINVIETIAGALDARDPYTCGHSRRVGQYAVQIAERFGLSPEECERIYITGLLHDVGKIGIPDAVLKKADRLTDEEFEVIKQHPTIGHTILSPLKGLAYALLGVLHHHERMDGRGYPSGLAGEDIPLIARILAVADSYDAMTSNRAYRNAMPAQRAREILQADGGKQWDDAVVTAFLELQQSVTPVAE